MSIFRTMSEAEGDSTGKVIVGSRKSELALIQTRHVISLLKKQNPDKNFEILSMESLGDKILNKALPKIGEKSLFTKELETALTAGEVQLVVHSLKDLPTTLPDGLVIGAVLKREDPRDAVVLVEECKEKTLTTLPEKSVIGTSALRRSAQLAHIYPHLRVENIRGNLNTRLRKLDEDKKYSALILAVAGLKRMGWEKRISQVLDGSEMMYAVGQGALAVECGENDAETIKLLDPLHDRETSLRIVAERSFLRTLGGGCSAPVAVICDLFHDNDSCERLELEGGVWSLDGDKELRKKLSCILKDDDSSTEDGPPRKTAHIQQKTFCGVIAPASFLKHFEAAYALGAKLASALIEEGATAIMEEARKHNEAS